MACNQIGGFEQARRADVTRAGLVKRRNVGKQFGVDDDLRVRIQFAELAEDFQIVRAAQNRVGQRADDDFGFADAGVMQHVALRDVAINGADAALRRRS